MLVKRGNNEASCHLGDSIYTRQFSPAFNEFNNSGFKNPRFEKKVFVALVGNPCHGKRWNNKYHLKKFIIDLRIAK